MKERRGCSAKREYEKNRRTGSRLERRAGDERGGCSAEGEETNGV